MNEENIYYGGRIENDYNFLKTIMYLDVIYYVDTSSIYFNEILLQNILVDCCFGC